MSNTSTFFKAFLILILVDSFWILTGGIYARNMMENIQGQPINIRFVSAGIVYLVLAYMLLQTTSYKQAFLYGVSIYAVYDFTNNAVFNHYDWKFAIADTLWGGVLFVLTRHLLKAF